MFLQQIKNIEINCNIIIILVHQIFILSIIEINNLQLSFNKPVLFYIAFENGFFVVSLATVFATDRVNFDPSFIFERCSQKSFEKYVCKSFF